MKQHVTSVRDGEDEAVNHPPKAEIALVHFPVRSIQIAEENSALYNEFSPANADDQKLIEDIRINGILTPLVLSADGYLLSGHRRLQAAITLGLETVPVYQEAKILFELLDNDERLKILRSYNQQREKSFDEQVAEALVDINEDDAYADVVSYRAKRREVSAESNVEMGARKQRAEITTTAFLDAVLKIMRENRAEWPISNRAIHYLLLNMPPLTHDSKLDSYYRNELSYTKKLSSLLTRARIAGLIPMEAICDEERPETLWDIHANAAGFIGTQQAAFLHGYARDLMQSQPHHVEIIVEKRTKYAAARNVAMNYTIPVTAGKGFASLPPRAKIAKRYRESRKNRLILIFLTDFDPDGEEIASSFARSMRDDFGIEDIYPIKAALTDEQVCTLDLPSSIEAKASSPNFNKFVEQHGTRAVELDAMPGLVLEKALKEAVDSVLDVDAFNHEVELERTECAEIAARRVAAFRAMGEFPMPPTTTSNGADSMFPGFSL